MLNFLLLLLAILILDFDNNWNDFFLFLNNPTETSPLIFSKDCDPILVDDVKTYRKHKLVLKLSGRIK